MPRLIVIALGMGAILAGILLIRGSPADQRLVDLANHHATQQARQSERLADLQQKWQAERADLYRQRDQLESDRRELATAREREPIIAQSILQLGTLAIAMLPLAICIVLLWRPREPESEAIAETLISDLVASHPRLLVPVLPSPSPEPPRLDEAGQHSSPDKESPAS